MTITWYEIYNKKTGECAVTHDQDEFCSKQVPEPFETVEEAEEYIRYLLETSPKESGLTLYDFEITKITGEY